MKIFKRISTLGWSAALVVGNVALVATGAYIAILPFNIAMFLVGVLAVASRYW